MPDPAGLDGEALKYLARLHGDFDFFLEELWREIGMKGMPAHHREIARWLQEDRRRKGVLAWRGAAKTWVTIAYCCWRLFRNPATERITYVSKSERAAKDSLYLGRKWIGQARFLQHLVPDRDLGNRDSSLMFDVSGAEADRTPSFAAYGITGQITGIRSTCIIGDDVETSENTLTLDLRRRMRDQVSEFENIIVPGGDIVYLGTPHHEETLYEYLIKGGYSFRAWPVMHPGDDGCGCELGPMYDGMVPGDLAWPDRFSREELGAREAAEGRSKFRMQYLLQWKLGDANAAPLRLSDAIVFAMDRDRAPVTINWGLTGPNGQTTRIDGIPSLGFGNDGFHGPIFYDEQWAPYTGCKMWVDPSGRGEDETAYAIVAHLNGYLFVKAAGGLSGGYGQDALSALAAAARTHRVTEIYVEDNFGQGMMAQLLEPILARSFADPGEEPDLPDGWSCGIQSVRVSTQKEIRIIESLEPALNSHRLVIHPDVAKDEDLQHQWTRITRQRGCLEHDDRIEALAMCVRQWRDEMAMDPARAAERTRQRMIEDELKKIRGEMHHGTSWIRRR